MSGGSWFGAGLLLGMVGTILAVEAADKCANPAHWPPPEPKPPTLEQRVEALEARLTHKGPMFILEDGRVVKEPAK